jgi:hypothetical protein
MSKAEHSPETTALPVIQLYNCPGKTYTRPVTDNEGMLGAIADINYASDPANHDSMILKTACDPQCRGPVRVPKKVLGFIPFGEEEVCPQGYSDHIDSPSNTLRA